MNDENSVVVHQPQSATMSMKAITDRVNLVHEVLNKVMKANTHFGKVPGCGDKLVLLKPGADLLAMTFRLVPQFKVERTELDDGHREYHVTCTMSDASGALLGQGVGSGSTMEKKYRYRHEYVNQEKVRIENEDIADVYNTVLKMAKKRAHVDATLTVTGAGDLFTQDLIDEPEDNREPVTMPKKKEIGISIEVGGKAAEVDHSTDKTPPPTKQQDGDPYGDLTAEGMIEDVSVKEGESAKGKWTKYGVKIDGAYFGTFSDTLGKMATANIGNSVSITFAKQGKFNNLATMEVAEQAGDSNDIPE